MKFSIITVNLNNREGLINTIKSVISQSCKDYEFIIIDGGSTDGSVETIKSYADKIAYWVSEPDKGIYNAMNKGVRCANGEYCLFLNSGDLLHSSKSLVELFRKGYTEDIISCDIVYEGTNISCTVQPEDLSMLGLFRNTLSHQSSLIRTSLLREMPYNENLRINSDWEFWIKALVFKNCSIVFDKMVLSEFNRDGISSTNHQLASQERKQIFEQLLPPRILKDYEKIRVIDDRFLVYGGYLSKRGILRKLAIFLLQCLNRF